MKNLAETVLGKAASQFVQEYKLHAIFKITILKR